MDSWLLALGLGFVLACGLVGDELLLDLVGVKKTRPLAVGLVDFVLCRGRSDAYEVVEGNVEPLRGLNFVSQTEDFLICDLSLVIWDIYQGRGVWAAINDMSRIWLTFFAPRCNDSNEGSQYGYGKERQPHGCLVELRAVEREGFFTAC
jgi:hypothetical protein